MAKKKLKLQLNRMTLTTVTGGPGHRTTNVNCTYNAWQSCPGATCEFSECGTCEGSCPQTACAQGMC